MDISKMRSVRISPFASAKVMVDNFPEIDGDLMFKEFDRDEAFEDVDINSRDIAMSAGALCLYAATLLGQVHENRAEEIEYEASEREQALKEMIKSNPKYASFSDEQIARMAHNLILKDIRNSFAHGNFEIDYDVYSKRLHYVLKPIRKDFIVDKPIIISKEALIDVNRKQLRRKVVPYVLMSPEQRFNKTITSHGEQMKDFLLMSDMLRLADNYLDKKQKHYEKFKPLKGKYFIEYYALLVSQLTYEQNDYYNLFNKDSNVFKQIAYMRNSMVHGGYDIKFKFGKETQISLSFKDRDEERSESPPKVITMLTVIREEKWLIDALKGRDRYGEYVQDLTEHLKNLFDQLFLYNGYEEWLTVDENESQDDSMKK